LNFKYDALGRRIEKTINTRTIQYLYDGLDIVQEIENGLVSVNYIRTLTIDEPLARIESNGIERYYQTDALGSVIALTDKAGAIKTQYVYDPFGSVTISGEISDNPFQYTGRENDGIGLYYYRARYYSPELQRFISEDPIRFKNEDNNFFAYAGNNPLNFTDPSGQTVVGAIGGIFGLGVGCFIIHCSSLCDEHCLKLYPPDIATDLGGYDRNRDKRMRCFFNCELYCVSFGAFGSDPLTGAVTAPSHHRLGNH